MHIFFSGIGGTAIGPLAMIAQQVGHTVSGSDKQDSQYIQYLRSHGFDKIQIGQSKDAIQQIHAKQPIDWYVYSSAVIMENPNAPELQFCAENDIKTSKRDELLNQIIVDKNLKLIAIAGTHGKTTTTAMAVWLFKQLGLPISYSVGAKISFGEMGQYEDNSEYFVLEADEFDRNFLTFHPFVSLITGVDWDHQEIFPTRASYQQAFADFMAQSQQNIIWQNDVNRIRQATMTNTLVLDPQNPDIAQIILIGGVNRLNAWLVINAIHKLTHRPIAELVDHMNLFPGVNRRFEHLGKHLITDYAHTVEKIKGCLQTATEVSSEVVVVYEPLTNRRQHYIKDNYKDLFTGVKKLYWVPSYLAREESEQIVLTPTDLIAEMNNQEIAEPAELNNQLKQNIDRHLQNGDLVVCMSGGGGGGLDEWLRANFAE